MWSIKKYKNIPVFASADSMLKPTPVILTTLLYPFFVFAPYEYRNLNQFSNTFR